MMPLESEWKKSDGMNCNKKVRQKVRMKILAF